MDFVTNSQNRKVTVIDLSHPAVSWDPVGGDVFGSPLVESRYLVSYGQAAAPVPPPWGDTGRPHRPHLHDQGHPADVPGHEVRQPSLLSSLPFARRCPPTWRPSTSQVVDCRSTTSLSEPPEGPGSRGGGATARSTLSIRGQIVRLAGFLGGYLVFPLPFRCTYRIFESVHRALSA